MITIKTIYNYQAKESAFMEIQNEKRKKKLKTPKKFF